MNTRVFLFYNCAISANGAGKTTTISMLTGMLSSSSGSATVGGFDVATQTAALRRVLGVCTQHDVLFGNMTAFEHVELFAKLAAPDEAAAARRARIERLLIALSLPLKDAMR